MWPRVELEHDRKAGALRVGLEFGLAVASASACVVLIATISYRVGVERGYAKGMEASAAWEERARGCEARGEPKASAENRPAPPPMPDFSDRLPPAQVLGATTPEVTQTASHGISRAEHEAALRAVAEWKLTARIWQMASNAWRRRAEGCEGNVRTSSVVGAEAN